MYTSQNHVPHTGMKDYIVLTQARIVYGNRSTYEKY